MRKFDPATGAVDRRWCRPASGGVDFGTYLAVIAARARRRRRRRVLQRGARPLLRQRAGAPTSPRSIRARSRAGRAPGSTFDAYLEPAAGANPVCRFYLPPANGDSHFYSASPAECADVRAKFPTFVYESPDVMYVALPDVATGDCPAGTREGVSVVEQARRFQPPLHGRSGDQGGDAREGLRRGGLRPRRDDHVRCGVANASNTRRTRRTVQSPCAPRYFASPFFVCFVFFVVQGSGAMLTDPHDLHRIRAARLAHRLADREHDEVAVADLALRDQQLFGREQHDVAIGALLEDTAVARCDRAPSCAATRPSASARRSGSRSCAATSTARWSPNRSATRSPSP